MSPDDAPEDQSASESASTDSGLLALLIAPARALQGGGRGWILLSVALGWLMLLGLRFVLPVIVPQVRSEFAVSNATIGFAITLVWITYGAMQFPAGLLADYLGTRQLLVGSAVATAASIAVFAVVPVFGVFLVACFVFGLGTGFYGPPRSVVLTETFPDRDNAAFGLTLASGSVGAALLPLVAGALVVTYGWRQTFLVFFPFVLLVAVALWRTVPGSPESPASNGVRLRDAVADGIGPVRVGIGQRGVLVGVAGVTLALFTFQGMTAFLPTYLIERKLLPQETATYLYALMFWSGAVFQVVAGNAADRFGAQRILPVVAAASVFPLLALPWTDGLLSLALIHVAIGLRFGMMPVTNAYIIRLLPDDIQGTAWGLLRTSFFAFGASGSVFVGWFADNQLFDTAFVILAVLTGVAAVIYLFLPARTTALS